jgi:hypothetical protein
LNAIKIRKKIYSQQLIIEGLKEFIGKNVEIAVVEEVQVKQKKTVKSLVGILSGYKDTSKRGSEKEAWKSAVNEKHGNR